MAQHFKIDGKWFTWLLRHLWIEGNHVKAMRKGIPFVSIDRYVAQQIENSKREKIEPEDIKTTTWTSGYIDKDGLFYGCPDLDHVNYAVELCKYLNVDSDDDCQNVLDKKGYVKISLSRFYWERKYKPTQAQKDAIWDYMQNKGMKVAEFETKFGNRVTFEEAFAEDV